jgi:1-acyl-sn-glycerol-3-phosphate acyltransferase
MFAGALVRYRGSHWERTRGVHGRDDGGTRAYLVRTQEAFMNTNPPSRSEGEVVRSRGTPFGFIVRLLVALVLTVPWCSAAILVGLVHREAGFSVGVTYLRFLQALFGIRVRVENENPEPLLGCVFVLLNQTSLLDGPVLAPAIPRPLRWITNLEYALIPLYGWTVALWGYVVVRQWPSQAKKTVAKAARFLKDGGNVMVSVEGRRSKDGLLSPYKKGPVVLAIEAKADIVPVVHLGVRDCMPHGAWRIRPGDVTVRFLRSIPTRDARYDDRTQLVEALRCLGERASTVAVSERNG